MVTGHLSGDDLAITLALGISVIEQGKLKKELGGNFWHG